jgi:lipopolysaccharide transport system ATP-binding protein
LDNRYVATSPWALSELDIDASACSVTDGRARLRALAICDANGRRAVRFEQAQSAHVFYEFESSTDLPLPTGGIVIRDELDRVVHGKSTIEYETHVPQRVSAGSRLQFHQVFKLDLAPGKYRLELGLGSCDPRTYADYRAGLLAYPQFARSARTLSSRARR